MARSLVGRTREVAAVRSALSLASGAVTVVGEAGVGKTELIRQALAARSTFEGGALASLSWLAYLPLRRAFPELSGDVWQGDPEFVVSVLERAAGDRAAVLVVDDLHWADEGTVGVVELLVGRVPLVSGVRRGHPGAESVLARLERAGSTRLDLSPLEAADSAELAGRLHPDLAPMDAERLLARAGGNPLLIEELAAPGAESLKLALLARIRPLDDDSRDTLALLAVAAHPLPRDAVPHADPLLEAGFLADTPAGLSIRHALLGEVVEEELSEERRLRSHRRLAALLEHPGDRARHHLAAGDRDRAHREAMAAVELAATPGERARHLAVAATCVDGDGAVELRLRAARAAKESGDTALAVALLHELPDRPEVRVKAAVVAARAHYEAAEHGDWQRVVAEGLRLAAPGTPEEISLRLEQASIRVVVHRDVSGGLAIAETAFRDCPAHGGPTAFAHHIYGALLHLAGDPRARGILERARDLARAEGELSIELTVARNLTSYYAEVGLSEEGRRLTEEMVERCQALQLARRGRTFRATRLSFAADHGEHELVLEEAPRLLSQPLLVRTREDLALTLGLLQAELGDTTGALRTADTHLADATIRRSSAPLVRAMAYWVDGRPEVALDQRPQLLAGWTYEPTLDYAEPVFAWAAWEAGASTPEPVLAQGYEPTEASCREVDGVAALRGGRHAEAAGCFARAAELWAPQHLPAAVRCRWAYGEALRLAGDETLAHEALLAVAEDAGRHGLAPVERRVERSLRALGVIRPGGGGRRDGRLTVRERDVLRLVAEGCSDRVIGARLGVSPRTVEAQIASARRKLGAANRRHAAELAAREESSA